jgi:hypothetical protein
MGIPKIVRHKDRRYTQHHDQVFRLAFDNVLIQHIEDLLISIIIVDLVTRPFRSIVDSYVINESSSILPRK